MALPIEQIVIAGLVQGVTEFVPVSSSAHLALMPHFCGFEDQGAAFDVMLHLGTLLAVLLYFRRDVWTLIKALPTMFSSVPTPAVNELWNVFWATLPVSLIGAVVHFKCGDMFRSVPVVAINSIIFGIVFLWADQRFNKRRIALDDMPFKDSWRVGLAQGLAVIPGVSRSGICLSAMRYLGYKRVDAARFTFLLSLPSVGGAVILKSHELFKIADITMLQDSLIGMSIALVSGLCCIHWMMQWLQKHSFLPFVLYRITLGVIALAWYYQGH